MHSYVTLCRLVCVVGCAVLLSAHPRLLPLTQAQSEPPTLEFVNSVGGQVAASMVVNQRAYLGEGHMLSIVDLSNPQVPTRLGQYRFANVVQAVHVVDNIAYVAANTDLFLIDVHDATQPVLRGTWHANTYIFAVHVVGGRAYLGLSIDCLQIVDVGNPSVPALRNTTGGCSAVDLRVTGATVYLVDQTASSR